MPRRAYDSAVRWATGAWLLVMFERDTRVEVASIRIPDEDAGRIAECKWTPTWTPKGFVYARTCSTGGRVSLHRFIMDAPDGVEVDHIDGDTTNCLRSNLRLVDDGKNAQNCVKPSALGRRNVYFTSSMRKKPYRVIVESKSGGHEHGGYFATIEEAEARARELRAKHFECANEERHTAPTALRRRRRAKKSTSRSPVTPSPAQ